MTTTTTDARRVLSGAGSQLANVGTELANRVVRAPGLVANLTGVTSRMRLRVCGIILSEPAPGDPSRGRPLASEDDVREALLAVDAIFRREADTELVFGDWPKVHTVAAPAPPEALDVSCGATSWREDLGGAGAYFRRVRAEVVGSTRAVSGYGKPVAVFVVRDIAGKAGCSMGPLSDYVTVDRVRARLIAHELGHCCGLWHVSTPGNLMLPAANAETMTRAQRAIFRNSRHVSRA